LRVTAIFAARLAFRLFIREMIQQESPGRLIGRRRSKIMSMQSVTFSGYRWLDGVGIRRVSPGGNQSWDGTTQCTTKPQNRN
jgi:hypothetical protein